MSAEVLWALGEVLSCQNQFMYCNDDEDRRKAQEASAAALKNAQSLLGSLNEKELYSLHKVVELFARLSCSRALDLVTQEILSRDPRGR